MPKSTFQQIPPEKQERVLREAARLFAERGFSQADVAELAARAGVSKGSLYTYFENKEALYLHVCRDGLARSRRAVYGGLRAEWELGRKLEHILHRGVAFAQSHPEYVALYINLSAAGMDQFADRLSREVEKFTADLLKSMLRQARDQGQLRPDLDVDLTAFLINSLYIVLLASLVSPHFQIRIKEYLGIKGKVTGKVLSQRIQSTVDLINQLLRPPGD